MVDQSKAAPPGFNYERYFEPHSQVLHSSTIAHSPSGQHTINNIMSYYLWEDEIGVPCSKLVSVKKQEDSEMITNLNGE